MFNSKFCFVFPTQLDVFQLVGVPLVENCLAGFNSSVFAYGQVPLKFFLLLIYCVIYVINFLSII